MNTRTLGRTNIPITPIGLGLAAIGRPGYITLGHADDLPARDVASMEQHAHAVLDRAWSLGIRYFDAARSYGRAEQFLASWVAARGLTPDEVTLGSKWGYTYTANWQVEAEQHEVKEHSLAVLQRQWGETQANLGGHLKLYQIHSATLSSGVLDNAEVLSELWHLKDAGTAIGLSLSGTGQPDTLRKALEIRSGERLLFDAVQATWNLLERSAEDALIEAHEAGLAVLVKEVLANGRLTPRSAGDPDFSEAYRLLLQEARRLETSVDALAMAAALHQPWATIVLSGAATEQHLISNVAALNVAWDEEAAAELSALREAPDAYWQTRSDLAWN